MSPKENRICCARRMLSGVEKWNSYLILLNEVKHLEQECSMHLEPSLVQTISEDSEDILN